MGLTSDLRPGVPHVMGGIDGRRLDRAVARLGNSDAGLVWLSSMGLGMPFARRAGIGIESDGDDGLLVVHATRRREGDRSTARFRVDALGAVQPVASGAPACHWSDAPGRGAHLLVLPDLAMFWLLEQAAGPGGLDPFVAVAPLHPRGLPIEWGDPRFWEAFASVTVVADDTIASGPLLERVGGAAGAKAAVVTPPCGSTWRRRLANAGPLTAAALQGMVDDAVPLGR